MKPRRAAERSRDRSAARRGFTDSDEDTVTPQLITLPAIGPQIVDLPGNPSGSMRRFHVPREGTLWLVASMVMFITGIFKGINLLILLAYLLIGLWVVNLRLTMYPLRRLRGRRLAGDTIEAGRPFEHAFEIFTVDHSPARGMTIESFDRRWLVLHLPGDWSERFRQSHCFDRRGRQSLPALRARSLFPFGLVGRAVELVPAQERVVLPRRGHVRVEEMRAWLQRVGRGDGRARVRQAQPSLMEADVRGLRLFRPGDSPRWIHWRTSARRGQLLVREFEDNVSPSLTLVVEPWLPERPAADDINRLESVISLAATICHDWARDLMAHLTLVIVGGETMVLPAGNGLEFARHALELLAVVEGTPKPPSADCLEQLPRAVAVGPLLVLSANPRSTLAGLVAGATGQPPAEIAGGEFPFWYQPPESPTAS